MQKTCGERILLLVVWKQAAGLSTMLAVDGIALVDP